MRHVTRVIRRPDKQKDNDDDKDKYKDNDNDNDKDIWKTPQIATPETFDL